MSRGPLHVSDSGRSKGATATPHDHLLMPPKPVDPQELEAAWTVAATLAGIPARRDTPRAPAGTHDYDIELDDGRTFALEVTTRVDSDVLKFRKALGNPTISAPELSLRWNIMVLPPTGSRRDPNVKTLKAQLPGLLAQVEPHIPLGCVDVVGETATFMNSPASVRGPL